MDEKIKITLIGIINGVDVRIDIEKEKTIAEFVELVCINSNNTARPFDEWIVQDVYGRIVPHHLMVGVIYDAIGEKAISYSPVLRLFFTLDYSKEEKKAIKASLVKDKIVLCAKEIIKEMGQVPTFGGSEVDKRLCELYLFVRELKLIEEESNGC